MWLWVDLYETIQTNNVEKLAKYYIFIIHIELACMQHEKEVTIISRYL